MARTNKQDKSSAAPDRAAPAPADQSTDSQSGGSDDTIVENGAGSAAIAEPGVEPNANITQEVGNSATGLPADLPSTVDADNTGASPSQPGDAGTASGFNADESASSPAAEVNPSQIEVYPLRSFMDEGELRRRGGPSYLVPRLHAEELELRNLISRTPLEE